MDELIARLWNDMVGRVTGPMSFRLLLQPAVATFLAIRAGFKDAREGHPLYGWSILTDPAHRVEFLRKGWKAVAKVFCLALVLDVIYQIIAIHWVYPVEALLVAFVLACLPYLLLRGPVNRVFRSRPVHERVDHP